VKIQVIIRVWNCASYSSGWKYTEGTWEHEL